MRMNDYYEMMPTPASDDAVAIVAVMWGGERTLLRSQPLLLLSLTVIVALVCAVRLRLLADERARPFVLQVVWLSWFLSAVALLLLPLDLVHMPWSDSDAGIATSVLANAWETSDENQKIGCDAQPITGLSVFWQFLFLTSTLLGFVMGDLLYEFECTGAFTWRRGLFLAVCRSACYYGVFVLAAIGLIVGLAVTGDLEPFSLLGWAIAVSNTWGILVLMRALSFALVEIPKRLWRLGRAETLLHTISEEERARGKALRRAEKRWHEAKEQAAAAVAALSVPLVAGEHDGGVSERKQGAFADSKRHLDMERCRLLSCAQLVDYEFKNAPAGDRGESARSPPPLSDRQGAMQSSAPAASQDACSESGTNSEKRETQEAETACAQSGELHASTDAAAKPSVQSSAVSANIGPIRATPIPMKGEIDSREGRLASSAHAVGEPPMAAPAPSPPPTPTATSAPLLAHSHMLTPSHCCAHTEALSEKPTAQPPTPPTQASPPATPRAATTPTPSSPAHPHFGESHGVSQPDTSAHALSLTTAECGERNQSFSSVVRSSQRHEQRLAPTPRHPAPQPPQHLAPPPTREPSAPLPTEDSPPPPRQASLQGPPPPPSLSASEQPSDSADCSSAVPPAGSESTPMPPSLAQPSASAHSPVPTSLPSLEALRARGHSARLTLCYLRTAHETAARRTGWWRSTLAAAKEPFSSPPLSPPKLCRRLCARIAKASVLPLFRVSAVFSGVLGGAFVWSELCLMLQWLTRVLFAPSDASSDALDDPLAPLLLTHQLLAIAQHKSLPLLLLLPLLWLRFCVGWGLNRIREQDEETALRGGRCTAATALLYDAATNCKLTLSLCFHYVCLLLRTVDIDQRGQWISPRSPSAFFCLYEAKNKLTLFGQRTDDCYPPFCFVLLLALCILHSYDAYARWLAFVDGAKRRLMFWRRADSRDSVDDSSNAHGKPISEPPEREEQQQGEASNAGNTLDELRQPLLTGVKTES